MKIVLLTQNDPFYMPEAIAGFVNKVNGEGSHQIVKAIITEPSPFGKRESTTDKMKRTYRVFGLSFFMTYAIKYVVRKFLLRKSVFRVLEEKNVSTWHLTTSINKKENIEKLKALDPDIIVIIAGNQIIKQRVLDVPTHGVINAHSSMLPEYKGLMPTFWVLKNDEKKTGVTVFFLREGIDDGPIINQEEIPIKENTTQKDLIIRCKEVANELLVEAINQIEDDRLDLKINEGGSYFSFPKAEDVKAFKARGKKFY